MTVAAEHRPTGRLVAFTELSVPDDRSRPAQQLDTLVLSEHRGHQLGMLIKIANLWALNAIVPAPQLVYTFNAEENRHMLDVNEAIGFRAVGHTGGWRKRDWTQSNSFPRTCSTVAPLIPLGLHGSGSPGEPVRLSG